MKNFSRNKIATATKPRDRGYILYQGPSQLDGEPIVVIATMTTSKVILTPSRLPTLARIPASAETARNVITLAARVM